MQHQFFDQNNSIASKAARHSSFVSKTYHFQVRTNTIHQGISVEIDDQGRIVAASFSSGTTMRNNDRYMISRTATTNELFDLNGILHPLD